MVKVISKSIVMIKPVFVTTDTNFALRMVFATLKNGRITHRMEELITSYCMYLHAFWTNTNYKLL